MFFFVEGQGALCIKSLSWCRATDHGNLRTADLDIPLGIIQRKDSVLLDYDIKQKLKNDLQMTNTS